MEDDYNWTRDYEINAISTNCIAHIHVLYAVKCIANQCSRNSSRTLVALEVLPNEKYYVSMYLYMNIAILFSYDYTWL